MMYYLLLEKDDESELPWIVAATDEICIEANGGFPDAYAKELALHAERRRQVIVHVKGEDIIAAFKSPVVKGKVVVKP